MRYSVVICSYNKLEYLKLVMAALGRTGVECEVILSDDGSDDGTVEWARESDLFDVVLESERSTEYRLCSVRNKGISQATGDYIILLDADCAPDADFFNGHEEVFALDPKGMSVGYTRLYDKTGTKIIREDHRRNWAKKSGKKVCSIRWMDAYGGNVAFPKSLWERVGGFDERYNGAWGLEDADFAYMIHKIGIGIRASLRTVVRHLEHPVTGTKEMRAGKGPNTKKFKDKHGFFPC
jgi:glycosyltransferase involved in cell wall biosynthesis